jgi:hypothetical protein
MEIKLLCHCGSKFKFDWDAARDGMPSRINCPACGLDVTLEAREVIKQLSGTIPTPPPPPPVPVPTAPPPGPRVVAPPPSPVPRTMPERPQAKDGQDSSTTKLVVVIVLVLVLGAGGFFAWIVGSKVYSGVQAVREMASVVNDASAAAMESNLQADDSVVLYIKHANHLEVAQACTEFWQTSRNKNLALVRESDDDEGQLGDHLLEPAYHGYVRITGPLEWPESHFDELAKFLSQRFKTLVFAERDVDFTGAFQFGVYESGERKFHARMDIVGNNFDEQVTVENEAWALQHGFKPGANGFKEFSLNDADEITKRLGMKLWDEPERDNPPPQWILRESP